MTKRKGFDPRAPVYLELIQLRRNDLRDIAADALQMQGIEESERGNLERAMNSLRSIDGLAKLIGEHPYVHVQAHALHQLWGAIGAVFTSAAAASRTPSHRNSWRIEWFMPGAESERKRETRSFVKKRRSAIEETPSARKASPLRPGKFSRGSIANAWGEV